MKGKNYTKAIDDTFNLSMDSLISLWVVNSNLCEDSQFDAKRKRFLIPNDMEFGGQLRVHLNDSYPSVKDLLQKKYPNDMDLGKAARKRYYYLMNLLTTI